MEKIGKRNDKRKQEAVKQRQERSTEVGKKEWKKDKLRRN